MAIMRPYARTASVPGSLGALVRNRLHDRPWGWVIKALQATLRVSLMLSSSKALPTWTTPRLVQVASVESQPASGPGQRGRGAGQPGGTNGRSNSIHRVSTGTMPGSVVDRARHVHPRPGLVVIDDGLPRLHSASAGTGRRTTDTEFVGLDGRGSGGMAKQPPERSP